MKEQLKGIYVYNHWSYDSLTSYWRSMRRRAPRSLGFEGDHTSPALSRPPYMGQTDSFRAKIAHIDARDARHGMLYQMCVSKCSRNVYVCLRRSLVELATVWNARCRYRSVVDPHPVIMKPARIRAFISSFTGLSSRYPPRRADFAYTQQLR